MKRNKSFIRIVMISITGFTISLLLLLVVVWSQSNNVVRENTIDSTKRSLSIYTNNIENTLDNTDKTLRTIMSNVGEIIKLGVDDESTRYYASIDLSYLLKDCMVSNDEIDILVIYNGKYNHYLSSVDKQMTYNQKKEIRNYVEEKTNDSETEDYNWRIASIGNGNYVIRTYEIDNRMLMAAIKIDNLMKDIKKTEYLGKQIYALTDLNGTIGGVVGKIDTEQMKNKISNGNEVLKDKKSNGIMVTNSFDNADFRLSCFINNSEMNGKMQLIQVAIISLIMLVITFMILFAVYVNNEIFKPMKQLLEAMSVIENGKYTFRISKRYHSREFNKINLSFNSMMDVIVNLKIQSYEEKIQIQDAELRYVHVQIKPHFFLNALTTIHSMSFQGRNEDIRTYINAFSKNVRYIFKAGLHTVDMREEVKHIEDYFAMQELLYPDCVLYYIDMANETKEWQIPQMLLHTFIENEYKHAVSVNHLLSIFIKINLEIKDGLTMAHIVIEDDGVGFPEEILQKMDEEQMKMSRDGHGIGLWNVKKTLELLYGRSNLIRFANGELRGGIVELWIPQQIITKEVD